MSDPRTEHWETVYRTKAADSVSWFQAEPRPSLAALAKVPVGRDRSLVDIGGGASSLVDQLVQRGWTDVTVLDISPAALDVARARLGAVAGGVSWIARDITRWTPERSFDVWHDRAVFHFLTDAADRAAYRQALEAGLSRGGYLIMATFAPDGPERCSGLVIQKYDADSLAAELGEGFELIDQWREGHTTPGGGLQNFAWAIFRRL